MKIFAESLVAMAAVFAVSAPSNGNAADAYVIGMTADITGSGSLDNAPAADAIRIYFDRVNQAGGINGHPVRIIVRDNQTQPSRAAADVKSFVNDEDVVIVVNAGLSNTYEPTISETKRSGMPVLFAGGVCPKEVFPPADPLLFCTSGYAAEKDAEFAVDYISSVSPPGTKLGLVSMAIPISRASMEHAAVYAAAKGLAVVGNETVPPTTPNYAPFATKLQGAGVDWVLSWAPWVTQIRTFEALRQLGWSGKFITYGHNVAEEELTRLKDPGFLVFRSGSMFVEGLPIHKEIATAVEGKTKFPPAYFGEGWAAAIALEAALKKASWPPSRSKVTEAMNDLTIDMKGLRGGPVIWTKANHFRNDIWHRVYGWSNDKNQITVVRDWTRMEIK